MPTLAEIDAEIAKRQAGPSISDIDAEIARRQEPKQENEGFFGASVIEPAMAVGSGIGSTIAAGLGGMAQSLNPFADEGAGAEAVTNIQEGGTYQPRTEAGKEGIKTLGEMVQSGIDLVNIPLSSVGGVIELFTGQGVAKAKETVEAIKKEGVSKRLGARIFEETDSPLAATIAETAPEAIMSAIGLGVAPKVASISAKAASKAAKDVADVTEGIFKYQSPTKRRIAEMISEGSTDIETAKFKLKNGAQQQNVPRLTGPSGSTPTPNTIQKYFTTGGPKVKKDKAAVDAIKQGFDEGVIAAVKGSSAADKHILLKMVANMERGKKNARFAMDNRPTDIVGDSLMRRFKVVSRANKEAGKKLDFVAKSLKGKPVNSEKAVTGFIDDLKGMGVTVSDDLRLNFQGSDIEGLTSAEGIVNRVFNRMKNTKAPDAYDLHRMKRFIDEQVTYGKSAEGLAGKSERVLKKLRANLDETLDSNFPRYDAVNTKYAETINVIDEFQSIAGKKMDLTGPNSDKAVGTLMRGIMSNIKSRVRLVDSVNNIEGVAKKYGAKFNDDLMTQVLFADELDSVFKPVARTSLQGQVGQAVDRAASMSPTMAAVKAVGKVTDKARGINSEGAFKAIKKLLINKK